MHNDDFFGREQPGATEVSEQTIRSERVTADSRYFLDYTERRDGEHAPLHYDFQWVDLEGNVVAGPFQAAEAAYRWQQGYDFARSGSS